MQERIAQGLDHVSAGYDEPIGPDVAGFVDVWSPDVLPAFR